MQLRMRKEVNTYDAVNARQFEHWQTDVPILQGGIGEEFDTRLINAVEMNDPEKVRAAIKSGADVNHVYLNRGGQTAYSVAKKLQDNGTFAGSAEKREANRQIVDMLMRAGADPSLADVRGGTPQLNAVAYDMAPKNTRTDKRDYRQSQPFVANGPSLAMNPYFDRYDPTRDPRNAIRELRAAVYEDKEGDRGIFESQRISARGYMSRYMPEGASEKDLQASLQAYEVMRPKMDNIQVDWRTTGASALNQFPGRTPEQAGAPPPGTPNPFSPIPPELQKYGGPTPRPSFT